MRRSIPITVCAVALLLSFCRLSIAQFTQVINAPLDPVPSQLSSGTQLNLAEGASTPFGFQVGSLSTESTNLEVNLLGGSIDFSTTAYRGSVVNFVEGSIGGGQFHSLGIVNVLGGSVESTLAVSRGGFASVGGGQLQGGVSSILGGSAGIFGGQLTDELQPVTVSDGSRLVISGGHVDADVQARSGSHVHLQVKTAAMDGSPSIGASMGEPLSILDRDLTLSGELADGSPFSFELNSEFVIGEDYFSPDAVLILTHVSGLSGDYNSDGVVDAADYSVWRDNRGGFSTLLLNNQNVGLVGDAHYETWAANYGTSLAGVVVPVPEANAAVVAAFGLVISLANVRLARTHLTCNKFSQRQS